MTSFVVNSAGGVPDGFEIVGASPATSETTGITVSPVDDEGDDDIDIPPRTVSAIRATAIIPAKIFLADILIFKLLNKVEVSATKLSLVAIHFKFLSSICNI